MLDTVSGMSATASEKYGLASMIDGEKHEGRHDSDIVTL